MTLLDTLAQIDPPGVWQVAQQLGYGSDALLRRWFPDLCKAITEKCRQKKSATIRAELARAIEEIPPPSLQCVAGRTGYSVAVLTDTAKEWCHELSKRRKTFRTEQKQALRNKLRLLLDENPPLSGPEIATRVGVPSAILRLRAPELWRALGDRRRVFRQKRKTQFLNSLLEEVRTAVRRLYSSGQYPSAARVSEALERKSVDWKVLTSIWRTAMVEVQESMDLDEGAHPSPVRKKAADSGL
jgi:hypothetical protein